MRRLFEPIPRNRSARRWRSCSAGWFSYGATAGCARARGSGPLRTPWDVLHQGLSRSLGLGIGTWAIIVSFIVFLGWLGLAGQRLGVGTLVNAVVVGLVIDLMVSTFIPARLASRPPAASSQRDRDGSLHRSRLGSRARDGLTTGIAAAATSIRVVRTTIEAAVLLTGFLLGGNGRPRHGLLCARDRADHAPHDSCPGDR